MNLPALGEAVVRLPWLCPCADSLITLAQSPAADAWARLRQDPGAVLLVLRHAPAARAVAGVSFFPSLLFDATLLEGAAQHLQCADGFVNWDLPSTRPIYQSSMLYARAAEWLAERSGRADPGNAWVAGLLAPLGWLAACTIDPDCVSRCVSHMEETGATDSVQVRDGMLEHAALARRLSRRWRLPTWLAAIAGHLDLPARTAQLLGAEPELFRLVQLAVDLVQRQKNVLELSTGASPARNADELGLAPADLILAEERIIHWLASPPLSRRWHPPQTVPLLRDLLLTAAENRRVTGAPALEDLESQVDKLHRALRQQHASEEDRLRTQKLCSLAEFAAGAGHEINNPLAVISGQAQYLLHHELDQSRRSALETIVNQARRIHLILSELMQFARPPRPKRELVDFSTLLQDVTASLQATAAQARVQLVYLPPELLIHCKVDPRQISNALACLLRNAIEAAAPDGWAKLRVETTSPLRLDVIVEDSGRGPPAAQQEHLFDPFYSGRQAGRGRGLGLPTAWRLAREHGGDVYFKDLPAGPTRFVLSLPLEPEAEVAGQGKSTNGSLNGHHGLTDLDPPQPPCDSPDTSPSPDAKLLTPEP